MDRLAWRIEVIILLLGMSFAAGAEPETGGRGLYMEYCSSCHGMYVVLNSPGTILRLTPM